MYPAGRARSPGAIADPAVRPEDLRRSRAHGEWLDRDVTGSLRCGYGAQRERALRAIAASGAAAVVRLGGHWAAGSDFRTRFAPRRDDPGG